MATKKTALDKTADRFLVALIEEVDPKVEPEESKEWAEAFLGSIRRFRERGNFRQNREVERSARLFGRDAAADPYRFFWEFWQNADDSGATEVIFTVDENQLVISNNGRPFNSREIYSLLFVASTTKLSRPDLMGQKGVGSLSLIRYSSSPIYESGNYKLKLEHSYTYPGLPEDFGQTYYDGTKVTAPFLPDFDPSDLFNALAQNLDEETLLYMNNLERVIVKDNRHGAEKSVSIKPRRRCDGELVTVGDMEWIRFRRKILPHEGLLRDDGSEVEGSVAITVVRQEDKGGPHPVCVYFPTKEMHTYPWRFSAPFDVTAGRENLSRSEFNRWLLRETGRTMVIAAKSNGIGRPSEPWELVPLKDHDEELLNEVWTGARQEMESTAWLPSRLGKIKPSESVFAESNEVRKLVTSSDLSDLGLAGRIWINSVPSERSRAVLENLGATRVCCHVLSRILEKGPPKRKSEWYLKTFANVIQLYPHIGGEEKEEIKQRLINGNCILGRGSRKTKGEPTSLVAAKEPDRVICNMRSEKLAGELGNLFPDSMVTTLHSIYRLPDRATQDPVNEMRRKVNEWLVSESSGGTFRYVSRLDASAFIKMFVVDAPIPIKAGVNSNEILMFVRDRLESFLSDHDESGRAEPLMDLGRSLLLRAHTVDGDGKKRTAFKPVQEVHLPSGYFENPSWGRAARGMVGIWWADSSYRKTLVRQDASMSMSVLSFLQALGAHDGPEIETIPIDDSHNNYQFTRVSHNNKDLFPNFPHELAPFGRYSQYGLIGDSRSTDVVSWLGYVSGLQPAERSKRGQAFLRTFENKWPVYEDQAVAKAMGYVSNGEYPIGNTPSRWAWELMHEAWVATSTGFVPPSSAYVRTPELLPLLDPAIDSICEWDCRNIEVANSLGFKTEVPISKIIDHLKEAQLNGDALPSERATSYYDYLSSSEDVVEESKADLVSGLIFAPNQSRYWWSPEECLQSNQHDVFGNFCGYLDIYNSASLLWDGLDIASEPDIDFLAGFWNRIGIQESHPDESLNQILKSTYVLAERLLNSANNKKINIRLFADGGWRDCIEVFATSSDEIANQLREHGLYRWDFDQPEIVPRFLAVAGVQYIENSADIEIISVDPVADTDLEEMLHTGIHSFGADLKRRGSELWPLVRRRVREILGGRVQRMNPLRIRLSLNRENGNRINCEVGIPAIFEAGNVFVSRVTKISDESLSRTLLSGLPLSGVDRWNAETALRLHLITSEPNSNLDPLDLGDEDESKTEPFKYFEPEKLESPKDTDESGPNHGSPPKPKRNPDPGIKPPPAEAHPVEGFYVSSDEGGVDTSNPKGGLTRRRKVILRNPGTGSGIRRGAIRPDRHSRSSTEQIAVELYSLYVLEPDGISINDQRPCPGVGADLWGSDNIFRELKSFAGSASDSVSLTSHESSLAGQARLDYELVIVEHVWDLEPVITIIPDPLGQLKYHPTGSIVVEGWGSLDPKPRVLQLKRTETE